VKKPPWNPNEKFIRLQAMFT